MSADIEVPMTKAQAEATDKLLDATAAFVRACGGVAIVGGGIEVEAWPDQPHRFRVCVNITGRLPQPPADRSKH